MDLQTGNRSRKLQWTFWCARVFTLTVGIVTCALGLSLGQNLFLSVTHMWEIQEEGEIYGSQLAAAERAFAGSLDSTRNVAARSLDAQAALFRSSSALHLRLEVMHRDQIRARQEQERLGTGLGLILQGIGIGVLVLVFERLTRGWKHPDRLSGPGQD